MSFQFFSSLLLKCRGDNSSRLGQFDVFMSQSVVTLLLLKSWVSLSLAEQRIDVWLRLQQTLWCIHVKSSSFWCFFKRNLKKWTFLLTFKWNVCQNDAIWVFFWDVSPLSEWVVVGLYGGTVEGSVCVHHRLIVLMVVLSLLLLGSMWRTVMLKYLVFAWYHDSPTPLLSAGLFKRRHSTGYFN